MSNVPGWVTDAIFYQIFPERFSNGDPSNDPADVRPWGDQPKPNNYFGGDLPGIIQKIDYIKNLGVNALYLNPIFSADSNHKYNTKDYLSIDPAFGTEKSFDELLSLCHNNNIRIVLDGVFNHVGTSHFAFRDVAEKGSMSKYAAWFNIYSFPVQSPKTPNYECWWGHGSLPKLMVQHPDVKKYLFEVTTFWTEKGIDGWRLDVPNELPHEFWKEWRSLVRSINPDCYIVGELWNDASPWLQGDEFDATMNYRFRQACLDFFATDKISADQFVRQLEQVRSEYSDESNYAMQNLLGSHDTERYLTLCKGEVPRVKLSAIFQYTYVGAPMTYYGDEVGMEGGKDPDCRRCMIWDPQKWNKELFDLHKKLSNIRNRSIALRRGDFTLLTADPIRQIVAYKRTVPEESVTVVLNKSHRKSTIEISVSPRKKKIVDELTGKSFVVHKGKVAVEIKPQFAGIFIEK